PSPLGAIRNALRCGRDEGGCTARGLTPPSAGFKSAGDEGVVVDPEAQAQGYGTGDADARACSDAEVAGAIGGLDREETAGEVGTVLLRRDAESPREIAGTAGQSGRVGADSAPARHRRQTGDRLQRAEQHAARSSDGAGDSVQAVMDPVVQIDVGVAALA